MATRQDLIDAIAKDGDMQKRSALYVLDTVLDNITLLLQKDGTVQIAGFGTFSVETRPARTGRNPRTGEAISVPERRAIKFLPAGRLLDAIS